jgi:hypothetical protein
LLAVIIILVLFPSFSSGKKDVLLSDIDALIEEQMYNDAMALLDDYIKQNPKDFDNAQKRVDLVLEIKNEYKRKADEFIASLQNEPENNEKHNRLIDELEALDKNPCIEVRKFISESKAAIKFIYYNNEFTKIMNSGAELLEQGLYTEATKKFSEGFVLYKPEFYEEEKDQKFVANIDAQLENVNSELIRYGEIQNQLEDVFRRLDLSIQSGNLTESQNIYSEIVVIVEKYTAIRNAIGNTGFDFRQIVRERQEKDASLTDASFLPFSYRFLLGRSSDTNTGILRVLDTQLQKKLENSKLQIINLTKEKFGRIEPYLSNPDFINYGNIVEISDVVLTDLGDYLALGQELNNLYELQLADIDTYKTNIDSDYLRDLNYTRLLTNELQNMILVMEEMMKQEEQFSLSSFDIASSAILRGGTSQYFNSLITESDLNMGYIQRANSSTLEVENFYRGYPGQNLPWDDVKQLHENFADNLILEANYHILNTWNNFGTVAKEGSIEIANEYTQSFTTAVAMINEPLSSDVSSFPSDSIPILQDLLSRALQDVSTLESQQKFLDTAPVETVKLNSKAIAFQEGVTAIPENISIIQSIYSQLNSKLTLAKERVLLAERAKNEAELRYNQAKRSMNNGDFESARDLVERSRAKYNESLSYQESKVIRNQSDTLLLELGVEIARLENEQVVRDVRKLKTSAKEQYYAGNFEQAEKLLVQAQNRWAVTNVDPDSEIINLLSLVGTALSMKTGRVISPTAPLYSEMSQILNMANQYFSKGKDLINKGEKEEALVILEDAKKKLRELQLVYPLNQEASLLILRIDQLIDPVAFDAFFKQKFEAAKVDYKKQETQQSAYLDLLDLYEINPKYPGLGNFIYQVEIALGIRVPPPDQKKINQSRTYTAEAQKIFDSGARDEISLNNALARLNQAISLYPDNESAILLKDRIQTAMGGQSLVVLPANQEALYQKAIRELSNGNTIAAAAIVTQLWQDPKVHRSAKVIDLKKKVDSLL